MSKRTMRTISLPAGAPALQSLVALLPLLALIHALPALAAPPAAAATPAAPGISGDYLEARPAREVRASTPRRGHRGASREKGRR